MEYQYNIPLYDIEHNNIGNLDVMLNLQDYGPYYRIKKTIPSKSLMYMIFYSFVSSMHENITLQNIWFGIR